MKSIVLFLLTLVPITSFGSEIYTFSDTQLNGGAIGFSLTTPNYIQADASGFYSFGASQLSSCDTSGSPAFTCAGGAFRQSDGLFEVNVSLQNQNATGFGRTDYFTDYFRGGNVLAQQGVTQAYDGGSIGLGATFTVQDPPDVLAAPEPASVASILAGMAGIAFRQKALVCTGGSH